MLEDLSIYGYGASVLVQDTSGGEVCARLRALLPQSVLQTVGIDDPQAAHYQIQRDATVEAHAGRPFRVIRDNSLVIQGTNPEEVANQLRSQVELDLAVRARDGLFVHAGAVAWRGLGILIPGRAMTGKSTLVAELVRRGATYYSDELAVIDDEGQLYPYARPLCLRDEVGCDRWQRAEDLGGSIGSRPVPVAVVVSSAYRAEAVWPPAAITGARAALPIIDNAFLAREDPQRTLRVAAALGSRIVTLAGPRPEAEVAASAILRFVEDLVEGRPCIRPPQHLRVENFLSVEDLRTVLDFALARQDEFAPSGIDTGQERRVDPSYRQSHTIYDLDPVWGLIAAHLTPLLPFVRKELGMPWFPPGQIERQLTLHREGDFFKVHSDNGSPDTAGRRLTAVFHLFREPRRFSGGELCLYHTINQNGALMPGPLHTCLQPVNNSIVFFRSDVFHDVRPVRCVSKDFGDSRCAVTMWCRAGAYPDPLAAPESETATEAPVS